MQKVNSDILRKLFVPNHDSSGEDNGQITIIGGSKLFHGAPILSLKAASRIVDMVFFASPENSVGRIAEEIKSELSSFIWVPWDEVDEYIKKSDAVLIGPGFMRYDSERDKEMKLEGDRSRRITKTLLRKFAEKKWVIDAGSLQTMEAEWVPQGAILTPNAKEFEMLFGKVDISETAKKYNCVIVLKGPTTYVCSPNQCVQVNGGNAGLTKGGTGDVQAGLTVGLLAKNKPFMAAAAAAFLVKASADQLKDSVGTNYNADDLALQIPKTFKKLLT